MTGTIILLVLFFGEIAPKSFAPLGGDDAQEAAEKPRWVGEIVDETDEPEEPIVRVSRNEILVRGSAD